MKTPEKKSPNANNPAPRKRSRLRHIYDPGLVGIIMGLGDEHGDNGFVIEVRKEPPHSMN